MFLPGFVLPCCVLIQHIVYLQVTPHVIYKTVVAVACMLHSIHFILLGGQRILAAIMILSGGDGFISPSLLQMGMSPSRIPQTQGMMSSHANNMVAQPANQGQFLPQGQFTAATGGAMNVNVNLGQPITQSAVKQVRRPELCYILIAFF